MLILSEYDKTAATSGESRRHTVPCPRTVAACADRLQVNAGIGGFDAHAAVRMHAFPVTGAFWGYSQKPKTPHFQRWKVAPPR